MKTTVPEFSEKINTDAIIKYSVTEKHLQDLERDYAKENIPTDLAVKENYEVVRKAVSHLRSLRRDVESRRKELKADALEFGKKVDSAAKGIKDRIQALELPIKTVKDEFDTRIEIEKREKARLEEERVEKIISEIAIIQALPQSLFSASSNDVMAEITRLREDNQSSWAAEFVEKAALAVSDTINKLTELHQMRVRAERDAAREEQDRKDREAREKAERAALDAERLKLAEENKKLQAQMEAQRQAMASELKAQQDAMAEQRAAMEAEAADKAETERKKLAEEQAEQDRLAEIERARIAKENFEAFKKEAIDDISAYNTTSSSQEIVEAIIQGNIRHIVWAE